MRCHWLIASSHTRNQHWPILQDYSKAEPLLQSRHKNAESLRVHEALSWTYRVERVVWMETRYYFCWGCIVVCQEWFEMEMGNKEETKERPRYSASYLPYSLAPSLFESISSIIFGSKTVPEKGRQFTTGNKLFVEYWVCNSVILSTCACWFYNTPSSLLDGWPIFGPLGRRWSNQEI